MVPEVKPPGTIPNSLLSPRLDHLQPLLTMKRGASGDHPDRHDGSYQDVPSDPPSPALGSVLTQRDNPGHRLRW
jgi:hypothetical protein